MPSCAFQARTAARDPHRARGPRRRPGSVALADLDRRRLAGTVGTEQGEDLTAADVEVQAVDGDELAVALDEPADGDRGVGIEGIPGCGRFPRGGDVVLVTRDTVSPLPTQPGPHGGVHARAGNAGRAAMPGTPLKR